MQDQNKIHIFKIQYDAKVLHWYDKTKIARNNTGEATENTSAPICPVMETSTQHKRA